MRCPYCFNHSNKVLDSRLTTNLDSIRRRRECFSCKKRFTTYERIETNDIIVVKKDNRREPFSREKLLHGILRACEKRPVKKEKISEIVDKIELAIMNSGKEEIKSRLIGEIVMSQLKLLDDVAYVRFASVYRRFHDATQFMEEVENLKNKELVKAIIRRGE